MKPFDKLDPLGQAAIPPPELPNNLKWPWENDDYGEHDSLTADSQHPPLISIVIPSFNQCQYIEQAIRSVLLQQYPNIELIVLDGGSSDGSVEVIKKYAPWISYWVSKPDGSYMQAVNAGWDRANGEIIGWLNSDDFYMSGAFWRVATEYRKTKFMVYAGGTNIVDTNSEIIGAKGGSSFEPTQLLSGIKPGSCATFYSRDVLQTIGSLRTDLKYNPDREFVLRISSKFWPNMARTTDTPLAAWRKWDETVTGSGGQQAVKERIQVIDEYLSNSGNDHLPRNIRELALKRIYMAQAGRERDRREFSNEIKYRLLALKQLPTTSQLIKIIFRCCQFPFMKAKNMRCRAKKAD